MRFHPRSEAGCDGEHQGGSGNPPVVLGEVNTEFRGGRKDQRSRFRFQPNPELFRSGHHHRRQRFHRRGRDRHRGTRWFRGSPRGWRTARPHRGWSRIRSRRGRHPIGGWCPVTITISAKRIHHHRQTADGAAARGASPGPRTTGDERKPQAYTHHHSHRGQSGPKRCRAHASLPCLGRESVPTEDPRNSTTAAKEKAQFPTTPPFPPK